MLNHQLRAEKHIHLLHTVFYSLRKLNEIWFENICWICFWTSSSLHMFSDTCRCFIAVVSTRHQTAVVTHNKNNMSGLNKHTVSATNPTESSLMTHRMCWERAVILQEIFMTDGHNIERNHNTTTAYFVVLLKHVKWMWDLTILNKYNDDVKMCFVSTD